MLFCDQYFDVSKVKFMRGTAFTITRRGCVVYCRMLDDAMLLAYEISNFGRLCTLIPLLYICQKLLFSKVIKK